ncbi:TolC family protein [bacterium]|nr:TolC family protein [bacterium]
MSNFSKKFLIYFLSIFLLNSSLVSFAVEETIKEDEKNAVVIEKEPEKLISGKITFEDITEKAKKHAYDIKIADFEILIAKQGIRDARSEYFPKIVATAGTEYTKNFKDYTTSTVTTVGDSFINPYTRFQSILGITLSYNVFDFGIRKNNLDIMKEDTKVKELLVKEQLQELGLTLTDSYCKLLITKKQLDINKEILALEQDTLKMKERLFQAKELSKTELNDQKIKVKQIEKRISELTSIAIESLNWISFYTGENYDFENITVSEFKKPDFDPMESNDYTKSITWQIQEKELKKKELELRIAKKNYLPKVNAYSRYYVYGSDHSSYRDAIDDTSPSNWTVGASVIMPVFDGFKTSAAVQKASIALQQQIVKRDKAIAELMTRLSTMRSNLMYLENQVEKGNELLEELMDKEKSTKRLAEKQIITPIELNDTRVQVLEQMIDYEKTSSTAIATLKGIEIITTY